ncbi:hypothetical protein [Sinorhizobium saheli]|nr:hypothetical protein [Sinorhizobium saheli]
MHPHFEDMEYKHSVAIAVTAAIGVMCVLLVTVSILGHTISIPPI